MNSQAQILVLSSESEASIALAAILQTKGWKPLRASRLSEGKALLAKENIGLVFCERRLADGTYQDLIPFAHSSVRKVPVVVTSRLADWDEYLEALRHGAVDLIASPCQARDVNSAIAQAQREHQETPTLAATAS